VINLERSDDELELAMSEIMGPALRALGYEA
jgi:hypothetical protein